MRHFLQYWKEKKNDTDIGTTLDQAESAQFRRVQPNDVLWIVTLIDQRLMLLGRIVVGKVKGLKESESLFWSGPAVRLEVIAKKGTEMKSIQADIQAMAHELRFNSERDRLTLYNRSRTDGKQLQILRELSPETVKQLQTVLESNVKRKIVF
jgi:hypothetical protein